MAIFDLLNPNKYVHNNHYKKRLAICNACPERLEKDNGKKLTSVSTCPICRCVISLKTKLSTEQCPLGDW
jgi:hypothetical protein